MKNKTYQFTGKIWRYSSDAASWYFVHLPDSMAKEIKSLVKQKKVRTKGFGFVPVHVTLKSSSWKTTLFPSKNEAYILSINKKVRNKEELDEGDSVQITFTFF